MGGHGVTLIVLSMNEEDIHLHACTPHLLLSDGLTMLVVQDPIVGQGRRPAEVRKAQREDSSTLEFSLMRVSLN